MTTLYISIRVSCRRYLLIALVSFLMAVPLWVGAAVLWDEQPDPDLSDDFSTPTVLPNLMPGANDITGDLDQAGGDDDDFARFDVLPNQTVTQIILTSLSNGASGAAMGFRLFNGPNAAAPQLIVESLSDRDVGTDIFDLAGFAGPLTQGPYTLLFDRTQNGTTQYGFSLTVIPLPLPIILMGSALIALIIPRFIRPIGTR